MYKIDDVSRIAIPHPFENASSSSSAGILNKQRGNSKLLKNFNKTIKTNKLAQLFSKFSTNLACIVFLTSALALSGCDALFKPKIRNICEDYPQFCADMNEDGWCRAERSEIIRHRYEHKDDDTDRPKYQLMINYENYESCISKAAQIEYKKYREKEFARKDAAVSINKALKQLQWQTKNSPDPYISYYQWSRFGYNEAKERFVTAARQGVFTEPKYYVDLASIEIGHDYQAAKNALFTALSQYANTDEEIDGSIASMLMTLYLENENYRMAYVWTKVTNHFADSVDDSQLVALSSRYSLPVDILDRLSDDIISAIDSRSFNAQALKIENL